MGSNKSIKSAPKIGGALFCDFLVSCRSCCCCIVVASSSVLPYHHRCHYSRRNSYCCRCYAANCSPHLHQHPLPPLHHQLLSAPPALPPTPTQIAGRRPVEQPTLLTKLANSFFINLVLLQKYKFDITVANISTNNH